jgi:hypothetical protein
VTGSSPPVSSAAWNSANWRAKPSSCGVKSLRAAAIASACPGVRGMKHQGALDARYGA